MNFKRLYLIMMNAAEKALDALDAINYGMSVSSCSAR